MSMEKTLKEILDEILDEVEQELEEATTTAGVDGYNTPFAFGAGRKKDKKKEKETATQAGYTIAESINEAMKPSQVRSAISKVKKGLMRKWKQKGGYENFGQKELSQMRDKFDYNPYGSSDERQIAKMLDGFDNWAMNYDGNMREGKKRFKRQDGIGKAKYTISYHDGKKKHKDGSDFFDIKIFKNKKDLSDFVGTLVKQGYKLTNESINEAKVNPATKKFLKGMQSIKVNGLGGYMPGVRNVYWDKKNKKFWFVDFEGDHVELLNISTLKQLDTHIKKSNIKLESINESKVKRPVNRWLELKNDETMHPHKKMAMGLKELKYQLKEVEKFFNWYNKIKTMNELDSQNYWKRTNNHIYTIKEKLIKIAKTIQEIEK